MKNIKYLFIIFVLFVFNIYSVNAEECDANDMVRLKELAKNVDISYEYLGSNDDDDGFSYDNYKVTIQGLSEGLMVGVSGITKDEILYSSEDIKDGKIEFETAPGNLVFNVYDLNCDNISFKTKNVRLFRKNPYASGDFCKELKKYNLDVCDENYQGELNDHIFYEKISPYLGDGKDDSVVDFLKRNLWIAVVAGILLLVGVVILIHRNRKRSVLE